MTRTVLALLALAVLATPGCDSITGCTERSRVIEVEFGDSLDELALKMARDGGWDCSRGESIRNAFGTVLGYRYNCTRCE